MPMTFMKGHFETQPNEEHFHIFSKNCCGSYVHYVVQCSWYNDPHYKFLLEFNTKKMFASLGSRECFLLSDHEDSRSHHAPFPFLPWLLGILKSWLPAGGSDHMFPNWGTIIFLFHCLEVDLFLIVFCIYMFYYMLIEIILEISRTEITHKFYAHLKTHVILLLFSSYFICTSLTFSAGNVIFKKSFNYT